jgi:hypothetical protein
VNALGAPTGMYNGMPYYESAERDPGHPCGECGRLLKVYHRRLSRSMARSLIRLYRLHQVQGREKYFHVKQFDKEGARGEFGVLKCWNLVREAGNQEDKRTSGMWAITEFGSRFVLLQEPVPLYAILKWRSHFLGFAGPMVDARQCLEHGNRFSYAELMDWTPSPVQGKLFL